MGLLSFVKTAGEKLFGIGHAAAAQQAAATDPSPEKIAAANQAAGEAIRTYIKSMNLPGDALSIDVDAANSAVTVGGTVPDQATKERILLCCGNVHGVGQVDDQMIVVNPEPEATYHTVVSGDSLSKISLTAYGNANNYMKIFEANKPMLSNPDRIYPGQVLRIPA
jgi:nucleoid-associated protein YgaU